MRERERKGGKEGGKEGGRKARRRVGEEGREGEGMGKERKKINLTSILKTCFASNDSTNKTEKNSLSGTKHFKITCHFRDLYPQYILKISYYLTIKRQMTQFLNGQKACTDISPRHGNDQ